MNLIKLACLSTALSISARAADSSVPPPEWADKLSSDRSPLQFKNAERAKTPEEWRQRRAEILADWQRIMGPWPALLEHPQMEILASTQRETFTQKHIRLQTAPDQMTEGYLLIPAGKGPFPAVFVPYYDPETSIGLTEKPLRDFALQLARRGFVTLAIGAPGGDARKPVLTASAQCQPLSYLAYISANAWQALTDQREVDAKRIGIVGHSYGGKWAMFGACLWEKYSCAVWSDPGVVFDETRASINYQEPWYLGLDPAITRQPGLISENSPRTGAYKTLIAEGHSLIELQALMAPRPFLVSGGAEDPPKRWAALNHLRAVNTLLGHSDRVAMTNREKHDPNPQSNAAIYAFFEHWLKP
jgi:dienelactone hydrolase